MNVYFPDNVFTRVLTSCLPEEIKSKIKFLPSAQITQSISDDKSSIGLIPVMDLLRHKDLFVSAGYGISFEESLCNSYIYYSSDEKEINKISLAGDVSSQEVILSKILFKEMYGSDIEIEILTSLDKAEGKNLLIAGDDNFKGDRFRKGISFSEIFVDTLSLPFVNYIFASSDKEALEGFEKKLEGIETFIYNKFEESQEVSPLRGDKEGADYIRLNISSFIFKFDEQDRVGIDQILRLPYFHGIVKDIVEVNFLKSPPFGET
jgi:hypothetical protein